jgi:signal peptidase I
VDEPDNPDNAATPGPATRPRPLWQEIPVLLLVAVLLSFLLDTFLARPYLIPSASMEPTLHGCPGCTGDRILVEKLSYDFGGPRPGDIVVFAGPPSWNAEYRSTRSGNVILRGMQNVGAAIGVVAPDENDFVKRVIATGGQTVRCCDNRGRIEVDGAALSEPYVRNDFPFVPGQLDCGTPRRSGRCFDAVTVPPGGLWVMGDNRDDSLDSRAHVGDELQGTVPVGNVRGKAVFRIWPPGRIGSLSSPDPQ